MSEAKNQEALSAVAVAYFMKRLKEDPRLAYIAGPGSQLYEMMCAAYASAQGVDCDEFKKEFGAGLKFQKVPRIGAEAA